MHTLRGRTGAATSLASRPKSDILGWASAREWTEEGGWVLNFCDFRSGQQVGEVRIENVDIYEVRGMSFNSDGTRLALAGDFAPRELDAKSGLQVRRYDEGPPGHVLAVAYTPDGRYLATGHGLPHTWGPGGTGVWDTLSGHCVLTCKEQPRGVTAVVFSFDRKRLVAGGGDGMITIWDLGTGQETLRLRGHTGPITSLAFSPDGCQLASASEDGTAKLWDARPLDAEPTMTGQTRH